MNFSSNINFIDNKHQDKIYPECVRVVYRRRAQNLLTHLMVLPLPVYLGWTKNAGVTNLVLISLLLAYTCFGYFVHFYSKPFLAQGKKVTLLGRSIYYQIAVLGILYNLIFLNLALSGVENAMVYLLLITALFSAGGVSSYQHLKWLGPLYIFSAMFPQAIYYLTTASPDAKLLSYMIVFFIIFMSNVGLQLNNDAILTLSLNQELRESKEEAEKLARIDMLTKVYNRRAFFEAGNPILKNAQRYKHPLSLVMLDIDHFKYINDTYGHTAGDEVLRTVAGVINKGIREADIFGRLGGEEFAIILQETDLSVTQVLTERLRKEVEQTIISFDNNKISVTVSFGVAQFDSENDDFKQLIEKADYAMYQAKKEGRNRVVTNTVTDYNL